ncbi:MAG: prepilin peptidase [Ruminococcus sp.]|nr:prepilin peptidase [Ruminococcus sp.]
MSEFLPYYIVIYTFVFLFGASIGSFLNVCIYRLPKEESLIKRNSHCMTCGEEIKRRDLIPIVSWCILRGKCRSCGAPISPRYTVVELLNAVLYLLIFIYFDVMQTPMHAILVCLLYSALIVVFFMDWDTQLISNYVVIFIAVLAVLEFLFSDYSYIIDRFEVPVENPYISQIIGAFAVSIPLLLIELLSKGKAMGRGDVYLMAACGLFLGVKGAVVAIFIGLITGSVAGLIQKHKSGDSVFAFGPWLSVGVAVAAIWGQQIGNWYLSFSGLANRE